MELNEFKERFLNKLAVAIVFTLSIYLPIVTTFIILISPFTPFFPLTVAYLFWIYFDSQSCFSGRRKSNWWRSSWVFQRFPRYFPQKMVKTADLPPTENYMFCMFPHGIVPTAGCSHFGSPNGSFYTLFPGLETTFHSLNATFFPPVGREIYLMSGFVSVSQECLLYHLTKQSGGHVACVTPGGVAEAKLCQPGKHKVVLKNRKGFVKVALKAGANLVPVYSFGENDLFDHLVVKEGHPLNCVQKLVKLGFNGFLPLINGVGLFQNYFGLLPRSKPVFTVVGRPIKLPKLEVIAAEDVDYWHAKFTEELVALFNHHKMNFAPDPEDVYMEIE